MIARASQADRWVTPRVGIAVGLVIVCGLAVVLSVSQIAVVYHLPSQEPARTASRHTKIFGPAVAAVVISSVMALLEIGWVLWNLVTIPRTWLWTPAVIAAVVAVLAAFGATGLDRPAF